MDHAASGLYCVQYVVCYNRRTDAATRTGFICVVSACVPRAAPILGEVLCVLCYARELTCCLQGGQRMHVLGGYGIDASGPSALPVTYFW